MKLHEDEVRVPPPDGNIRAVVISPVGDGPWPGVLLYTDIFQLTESTLRTARRLAPGFLVCAPEIYPHGDLAGVALEFDDAGKQAGLAGAAATTTAHSTPIVSRCSTIWRGSRRRAAFATGFCLGGHLAFRAAFDQRVEATVCFYPTGLQDGALGADDDAARSRTPGTSAAG